MNSNQMLIFTGFDARVHGDRVAVVEQGAMWR